MERIRIQKYISECGIMSRRAAEAAILAGRITVNGIPARLGQKIDPDADRVEYAGRSIKPPSRKKKYIMLNKPRGYLSSVTDDRGRRCVTELVAGLGRVWPAGRLDMDSLGLLLLTDDGELTYRLTHPKHGIPKIYHVTLSEELADDRIRALGDMGQLDGYKLAPVGVSLIFRGGGVSVIEITLYEGRNRQIRRMCGALGLEVLRLSREAIGKLRLGDLPPGKWRPLSKREVDYLFGRVSDI
jgi:23S rRNA pseudouridine2605 synthase